MSDTIKDELQYGEILQDIRRYVSVTRESNLLDSLACTFHNDGYGLQGNTEAKDGFWLAREMYKEMHHGDGGHFEDLAPETIAHWTRMAESAVRCLPGLMSRVSARMVAHSKVLRSLERAMREDRKRAAKKIGADL